MGFLVLLGKSHLVAMVISAWRRLDGEDRGIKRGTSPLLQLLGVSHLLTSERNLIYTGLARMHSSLGCLALWN